MTVIAKRNRGRATMSIEEDWDFDAWSEGHWEAMRERDWRIPDNPYEPGSLKHRSWADGYRCGVIDRKSCRD